MLGRFSEEGQAFALDNFPETEKIISPAGPAPGLYLIGMIAGQGLEDCQYILGVLPLSPFFPEIEGLVPGRIILPGRRFGIGGQINFGSMRESVAGY